MGAAAPQAIAPSLDLFQTQGFRGCSGNETPVARAGQPFLRSVLPMLLGMAATFALVATLAAVGGGWAVAANTYARWAALAILAIFGLALLLPSLSDPMMRPLVGLGDRLSQSASQAEGGAGIACSASANGCGAAWGSPYSWRWWR